MSVIYTSVNQLIGNTPLLELTHMEKEYDLKANHKVIFDYLFKSSYMPV